MFSITTFSPHYFISPCNCDVHYFIFLFLQYFFVSLYYGFFLIIFILLSYIYYKWIWINSPWEEIFVHFLKNFISFNLVYHLQKNTYNLSKFITTIQRVHVTMGWSHKYMFPISIFFLLVYFSLLLYFFLLLISLHFPVIVCLPIIAFLFFNCYFPSHYFISLCYYSSPYHYIFLYYHIFSVQVDSVLLLISFITCYSEQIFCINTKMSF